MKRAMIEPGKKNMAVSRQCQIIGLSKTAYYYHKRPLNPEMKKLLDAVDEIYTKTPFYGTRKIGKELRKRGFEAGRMRIRSLMNLLGVEAIYPKRRLSIPNKEHRKYPYLMRGVSVTRPNQVWCADITYIRLAHGFVYLVAVLDWYSRHVMAWQLSTTLDANFCLEALREALRHGTPEIFNVDQGAQFTSREFLDVLEEKGIKISMDGTGRAFDNIFVERFWRSLKYEEVYLKSYESVWDCRWSLKRYMEFYNQERIHQSLEYRTPAEVHFSTREQKIV
jgi:putative transposase